MSKTTPAGLGDFELWIYDASLALLLAQLVSLVESALPAQQPIWWSDIAYDLRVHAAINDLYFDIGCGLNDHNRDQLAQLYDLAADHVKIRGSFTREEANAWPSSMTYPSSFAATNLSTPHRLHKSAMHWPRSSEAACPPHQLATPGTTAHQTDQPQSACGNVDRTLRLRTWGLHLDKPGHPRDPGIGESDALSTTVTPGDLRGRRGDVRRLDRPGQMAWCPASVR